MQASGPFFRAGLLGALTAALLLAVMLGLSRSQANGLTQDERLDAACTGLVTTTFTVGTQSAFTPAQTFTAVNTGRLTTAGMLVAGDGRDVGDLVAEIRAVDASGVPTNVVLASASIPASEIANGTYNKVSFDPGAEVVAGQQYALVLSASEEAAFSWGASDPVDPCPGGQVYTSNGGGPFEPHDLYDLRFETYVTPAPDTIAPKVTSVVPAENATGSPGANVTAAFSEAMDAGSINTSTVELFKKGSTTPLEAEVSYDVSTDTEKAVLNPKDNLKIGGKYKAVVTTGAQDLAGNRLDQDPTLSGNQPKEWFFRVKK